MYYIDQNFIFSYKTRRRTFFVKCWFKLPFFIIHSFMRKVGCILFVFVLFQHGIALDIPWQAVIKSNLWWKQAMPPRRRNRKTVEIWITRQLLRCPHILQMGSICNWKTSSQQKNLKSWSNFEMTALDNSWIGEWKKIKAYPTYCLMS